LGISSARKDAKRPACSQWVHVMSSCSHSECLQAVLDELWKCMIQGRWCHAGRYGCACAEKQGGTAETPTPSLMKCNTAGCSFRTGTDAQPLEQLSTSAAISLEHKLISLRLQGQNVPGTSVISMLGPGTLCHQYVVSSLHVL
jgi:hypothetical protein